MAVASARARFAGKNLRLPMLSALTFGHTQGCSTPASVHMFVNFAAKALGRITTCSPTHTGERPYTHAVNAVEG